MSGSQNRKIFYCINVRAGCRTLYRLLLFTYIFSLSYFINRFFNSILFYYYLFSEEKQQLTVGEYKNIIKQLFSFTFKVNEKKKVK